MVFLLHAIALAGYLLAGGVVAVSFAADRANVPRFAAWLLAASVALHAAALVAFGVRYGELPLAGLAPALSTLAFVIAAFLLSATILGEARPVGLVLVPLIAIMLGTAVAIGVTPAGEPLAFRGIGFALHVMLAFLGYAGFAVAFAAGLCYLLQFRELKDKHFGRVFRFFPALPVLDRLGRWGAAIGFTALTSALLLGWAWTLRFRGELAVTDPKTAWAVLTWLLLGAVLAARRGATGREWRGAALSVVGFSLVLVTYLILRLGIVGGRVFL